MKLFNQSIRKFQAGAALIEFAIIVPLLLLLVVGIIEFSYAFYHLNILNKSVHDGARYFADPQRARQNNLNLPINTNSTTNGTNINATKYLVIYGNTAGTGNALMPNPTGNYTVNVTSPNANHIMVTATYQHNFILGNVLNNFTKLGITNPFPLTASSVLRVE